MEKMPGIHFPVPREQMSPEARKLRDFYEMKPGAPLVHREFGFYCLERWYEQGLPRDAKLDVEFGYDLFAKNSLGRLGWCEAAFCPNFEVKLIEDRQDTEVEQDAAGRHVLYFKGRRSGFMPEYIRHPVTDQQSWEENVKWRLDVAAPGRFDGFEKQIAKVQGDAAKGYIICLNLIGGYMYLRSLIGPEDLLYKFHDAPELLHDCMRTWLTLADAVSARFQAHVTLDEVYFAEDICYNHGSLIAPDHMREFLTGYYQQLIANVRTRQLDRNRHLYVQVDTDGFCDPTIPIYRETIGMDYMSPFEVASNCDVVRTGKQYPDLRMLGGIDKRILAAGLAAIDRELERIIPTLMARGGYIPTCDHGVPEEVTLANYRHYRRRMLEYSPRG